MKWTRSENMGETPMLRKKQNALKQLDPDDPYLPADGGGGPRAARPDARWRALDGTGDDDRHVHRLAAALRHVRLGQWNGIRLRRPGRRRAARAAREMDPRVQHRVPRWHRRPLVP